MQDFAPRISTALTQCESQARVAPHGYIAYQYDLQETASRLKRHGYRGAICGPGGCGKTTLLQSLGDELMAHGLSPLPLSLDPDRAQALPLVWRRTIRKARHTDALLLDDYDLLPVWARAWVWAASMRAGAVVVTARLDVRFKTLAKPKPTAALLQQIAEQRIHTRLEHIDYDSLFAESGGNLNRALELIRQHGEESTSCSCLNKRAG